MKLAQPHKVLCYYLVAVNEEYSDCSLILASLVLNCQFTMAADSLYAKGMTTGDIETHIRDIYGLEVSDTTVSRITDKILPVAKEWQQRPLESVYAVVFLDVSASDKMQENAEEKM